MPESSNSPISRRAFGMTAASAVGAVVSASQAGAQEQKSEVRGSGPMLDLEKWKANINPDRLRSETNQLINALIHPAFVKALRDVRSAPIRERLMLGSKRLTPQALREQGVPLPSNMRISSRYFEEGLPQPVDFGDLSGRQVNVVNLLNEIRPGYLDRLRVRDPEAFRKLIAVDGDDQALNSVGACCCGGTLGTCAGCGDCSPA